jgi:REP element-mobilizing transposase RayT
MRALKGRHKNLSHAFVKNHIHLVFGVKDRRRKIDQELLPELWPYIAGICRNQGMAAIAVNGMNDVPFAAGYVTGRRSATDQE